MTLWDLIDQGKLGDLVDRSSPVEFVVLCLLILICICIVGVALNSLYGHRGGRR